MGSVEREKERERERERENVRAGGYAFTNIYF